MTPPKPTRIGSSSRCDARRPPAKAPTQVPRPSGAAAACGERCIITTPRGADSLALAFDELDVAEPMVRENPSDARRHHGAERRAERRFVI